MLVYAKVRNVLEFPQDVCHLEHRITIVLDLHVEYIYTVVQCRVASNRYISKKNIEIGAYRFNIDIFFLMIKHKLHCVTHCLICTCDSEQINE